MAVIQPHAVNQGDVYNLLQALVNRVLGAPTCAVSTSTTGVKTTTAVYYSIAGKLYTRSANDNNEPAATLTNTGATDYCKLRIEVDTAGTISLKQGGLARSQEEARIPRRTASKATLGWVEVPNNFTFKTSLFSAAGVTFYDGDPDLGAGVGVPPNDRGIAATVTG